MEAVLARRVPEMDLRFCQRRGWHASVVIAFMLMPDSTDDDLFRVMDFEQRNATGTAERNDEFTHKCAFSNLSATERTVSQ